MPVIVTESNPGKTAYASAIIGDYDTLHVKVDVSALRPEFVDPKGFLKPNVPLGLNGLPLHVKAGTAQVETATVAGTVTAAGNASVIVTAADMANSPKTLLVPVANSDTAAQVAAKIRTALAADADIADAFAVSGTGADVVLTDLTPDANDSTLNIAIATGTATGITAAPTSANTTAGVAGAVGMVPCLTIEPLQIALSNAQADLNAATDPLIACAVTGVLNRDIIEDTLGRALSETEVSVLNGAASKLVLSL